MNGVQLIKAPYIHPENPLPIELEAHLPVEVEAAVSAVEAAAKIIDSEEFAEYKAQLETIDAAMNTLLTVGKIALSAFAGYVTYWIVKDAVKQGAFEAPKMISMKPLSFALAGAAVAVAYQITSKVASATIGDRANYENFEITEETKLLDRFRRYSWQVISNTEPVTNRVFGLMTAVGQGAFGGYLCYWIVRGLEKLGSDEGPALMINPVAFALSGMVSSGIVELSLITYDVALAAIGDRAVYEHLEITEETELLARFRRHSWKVISKVEKIEKDIDVIYSRLFNVRTEQELKAGAVKDQDLELMEVVRRTFAAQVYETFGESVPQELGVRIVQSIGYTVAGAGQLLSLHVIFFCISFFTKVQKFYQDREEEEWNAIVKTLKENGLMLGNLTEKAQNHKILVKIAVAENGLALQFAGSKHKKNKEVVLIAIQQNHEAFAFADEELQKDPEILAAKNIKQNGLALANTPNELKENKGLVVLAVKQNGLALEFAPEKFQNDKAVVKLAVKQNGLALKFAGPEFKKDKEVVLAAIQQNHEAFDFADEELQKDPEILIAKAIKAYSLVFDNVSEEIKNDKRLSGLANTDFMMFAVKQNGLNLKFAHPDIRKNKDVVLSAMQQNHEAFAFADAELQNDKEILAAKERCNKEQIKANEN